MYSNYYDNPYSPGFDGQRCRECDALTQDGELCDQCMEKRDGVWCMKCSTEDRETEYDGLPVCWSCKIELALCDDPSDTIDRW